MKTKYVVIEKERVVDHYHAPRTSPSTRPVPYPSYTPPTIAYQRSNEKKGTISMAAVVFTFLVVALLLVSGWYFWPYVWAAIVFASNLLIAIAVIAFWIMCLCL